MQLQLNGCRVLFPDWYDDRAEWEAEAKGWLPGVVIEFACGDRYPITFYDPVRLSQDLDVVGAEGEGVIAEVGMAVIPTVTTDAIARAVQRLVRERFFDHLKPLAAPMANGVHTSRG